MARSPLRLIDSRIDDRPIGRSELPVEEPRVGARVKSTKMEDTTPQVVGGNGRNLERSDGIRFYTEAVALRRLGSVGVIGFVPCGGPIAEENFRQDTATERRVEEVKLQVPYSLWNPSPFVRVCANAREEGALLHPRACLPCCRARCEGGEDRADGRSVSW